MRGSFPGEFEQMVLLVVLELGDEAYGAQVGTRLRERTGREPSTGALYTTLQRLEAKGLVTGREGEATSDRGGRPRRYFKLTRAGLASLRRSRDALQRLWAPVADLLDEA
jgi:DNA-binding PadR family transcriptional regulator